MLINRLRILRGMEWIYEGEAVAVVRVCLEGSGSMGSAFYPSIEFAFPPVLYCVSLFLGGRGIFLA